MHLIALGLIRLTVTGLGVDVLAIWLSKPRQNLRQLPRRGRRGSLRGSVDAELHFNATHFMMSKPTHMYHPQPKQAWDLVYSLILLAIQQWKQISKTT